MTRNNGKVIVLSFSKLSLVLKALFLKYRWECICFCFCFNADISSACFVPLPTDFKRHVRVKLRFLLFTLSSFRRRPLTCKSLHVYPPFMYVKIALYFDKCVQFRTIRNHNQYTISVESYRRNYTSDSAVFILAYLYLPRVSNFSYSC